MTDKKVLIKPEQGETKEEFKARLKAALGVDASDTTAVNDPSQGCATPGDGDVA